MVLEEIFTEKPGGVISKKKNGVIMSDETIIGKSGYEKV